MAKDNGSAGAINLIDTASLFLAGEALGKISPSQKRLAPDYTRLRAVLDQLRAEKGWPVANATVGLVAVDPSNEAQRRFLDALGHSGIEVDAVDYRSTFPSDPPGGVARKNLEDRQHPSFTARLSYIVGLAARHPQVSILIISHAFELYAPLLDLGQRVPNAKVGIAYFSSHLDYRWHRIEAEKASEHRSMVDIFDLDPFGDKIFGIQIAARHTVSGDVRSGLSRF